ncbi:MAG TPA: sulfurtransferase TusA family protein [Thiotrichaceae bacterium]|nr:sulfurtransferase TusA family protein [Thiotrichaceae bacterium]
MLKTEKITLDARNLLCPMPVIRIQNAVSNLATGTQIEAICSDPGVLHDIPAWARVHGHTFIGSYEKDDHYIVCIEVNNS